MDPELIKQLMALGVMPEQQDQLQQQIDQQQWMQRQKPTQHSTAWGGALGGLGDVIGAYQTHAKEGDLRKQYADILSQKLGLRSQGRQAELDSMDYPGSHVIRASMVSAPDTLHAQMVQPGVPQIGLAPQSAQTIPPPSIGQKQPLDVPDMEADETGLPPTLAEYVKQLINRKVQIPQFGG